MGVFQPSFLHSSKLIDVRSFENADSNQLPLGQEPDLLIGNHNLSQPINPAGDGNLQPSEGRTLGRDLRRLVKMVSQAILNPREHNKDRSLPAHLLAKHN